MPCGFGKREFSFASSGRPKTLSPPALTEHQLCAPDTMSAAHTLLQFSEALLLVAFIEGGKLQLKEVKELPPRHTTSVRFKPGPSQVTVHMYFPLYYTWVFPDHCRNVTSNSYSHRKMM